MKILITGVAGYICSNLADELCKDPNNQVVGVDNAFNHIDKLGHLVCRKNFTFFHENIWNIDSYRFFQEADTIIHGAALVGFPACAKNPVECWKTNFYATRKLVENSQNKRFIWFNTNSCLGANSEGWSNETSICNPISEYAKSKMAAEEVLIKHPNSISLRLSTVWGVGKNIRWGLLVNSFVKTAYEKRKLEIFEGHFRRNHVHLSDVIRATQFVMNPHLKGIYCIGDDTCNLSKLQLANKIAELIGGIEGVSVSEIAGEDSDKRDYFTSSKRIKDAGFKFKADFEEKVEELLEYIKQYGV